MADLRKQAIAILPMKQEMDLRLAYGIDWHIPVKRIWSKSEVERYLFRLYNLEREEWFECGPKLAGKIVNGVAQIVAQNNIDVSKLKDINIKIIKDSNERNVFVDIENLPVLGKFAYRWNRIKKIFGFGGYKLKTNKERNNE